MKQRGIEVREQGIGMENEWGAAMGGPFYFRGDGVSAKSPEMP